MFDFFLSSSRSTQIIISYLVGINLITFLLFGADKIKSVHRRRRIRERTLYIFSLIGGSVGAFVGMNFFRHKTKKLSFQTMMAVIFGVHVLLIYLLLEK